MAVLPRQTASALEQTGKTTDRAIETEDVAEWACLRAVPIDPQATLIRLEMLRHQRNAAGSVAGGEPGNQLTVLVQLARMLVAVIQRHQQG